MTDETTPVVEPTGDPSTEETKVETSAEGGEEVKPAEESGVEIDGKKYTVEELKATLRIASDYEKLLPEYTKKSQALAALTGGKPPEEQKDVPSFLRPDWKPKSYQELGQALKEATEWGQKQAREAAEAESRKQEEAKAQLDTFVGEVKKVDPTFDAKDFWTYIERHKFQVNTIEDVKSLYSSYKEANADGKLAERLALSAKVKRTTDSIGKPGGAGGELPFNPQEIRTSGGGILDKAREALNKIK